MTVSQRHLVLQFDGGSRGNPGPAAVGLTLRTPDGKNVYELGEFIGTATNNVAEYKALIRGVEAAKALGAGELTIRADSELVVRQILGIYKVRNAALQPLHARAHSLLAEIPKWKMEHVYRESNARPDTLANLAMDRRERVEPLGPPSIEKASGAAIDRGLR